MNEIAKYPLLSPEEEYSLAVQHFEEQDIHAAHRLVTANLRLVVKIAHEFSQARLNVLDLIQEGNAGLMQAVKRFNPYKGVKLSTYASWWIRAYVLKYIMENKSQVKIGTTAAQRKLFFNLKKEAEKLLQEYQEIDPKLLAQSLDVKVKDVIEMQQRLENADVSLDAPLRGRGEEAGSHQGLSQVIPADQTAADDLLATQQIQNLFREHLAEFQKTLTGRDLDFFKERLLSENPMTLQELGTKYGISRERARQLEARIIEKLKTFVQDKGVIDIKL